MFAVIFLPEFYLQARLRNLPHLLAAAKAKPIALLELTEGNGDDGKARILATTDLAREMGVESGMTAAQGQARCGELILLNRSADDETAAQGILTKLAVRQTPDFEETAPGACTLNLIGAPHWNGRQNTPYGREWDAAWELVEELAAPEHSLRGQIGIAGNPDLARLIAKLADPVRSVGVGDENALRDFLAPLPLAALEPPPDLAMVLALWGISTVGDFLALPKKDLAERIGAGAIDLWETVQGKKSRLLRLTRPPTDFSQVMELDHEIQNLEPLLLVIRRVLETICTRLATARLVAGDLHLRLDLSNEKNYQRSFRVQNPTCDVEVLFGMLHAHLENFNAAAPVIGLGMSIAPTRATWRQFRLFEPALRDPNRLGETLARLEGLLGRDRVGSPELPDTHRPDVFRIRPFQEGQGLDMTPRPPGAPPCLGLPLRRLRPPVRVEVTLVSMNGSPRPARIRTATGLRENIRHCRGPWRSSGNWWEPLKTRWSREEWDVELENGALCRLVRREEKSWVMEGFYG